MLGRTIASLALVGCAGCNAVFGIGDLELDPSAVSANSSGGTGGAAGSGGMPAVSSGGTGGGGGGGLAGGAGGGGSGCGLPAPTVPEALVSGPDADGASGLVVGDDVIMWTAQDAGNLMFTPRSAPSFLKPALFIVGQNGPAGLAADATHYYWTNVNGGTVARRAKQGGAVETLASGQTKPAVIAVDTAHVYWTNLGSGVAGSAALLRTTKTPGDPIEEIYVSSSTEPHDVVAMAGTAYFAIGPTSTVGKIASTTANPTILVAGADADRAAEIAVDATHIYFGEHRIGGRLRRMTVDGAMLADFGTVTGHHHGLVVDESYVYWIAGPANMSDYKVYRRSKQGGVEEVVASGSGHPRDMRLDCAAVFWTDYNTDQVWWAPR